MDVASLETKHNSYASFRITCECDDPSMFMDPFLYGAPFSHLFTELPIPPIEVHISAIELEKSPNRQYLEISAIDL